MENDELEENTATIGGILDEDDSLKEEEIKRDIEILLCKIALARTDNRNTNIYNSLMALYMSLCSLIVGPEALTCPLILGTFAAAYGEEFSKAEIIKIEKELKSVRLTLYKHKHTKKGE